MGTRSLLAGSDSCHSVSHQIPANIPAEIYAPLHLDNRSLHWPSRQKRGRRGGTRCRMKRLCLDDRRRLPPLPSVFLSNAQSLRHKTDEPEIWAKFKSEIKECCLLAITEIWLNEGDEDSDLALTGFGCPFRLDRSSEATGEKRGGGVCFYVNQRYCNHIIVREAICTTDVELLSISLRPFCLPREFPQLFFTLVYVHPQANASAATQLIVDLTHKLGSICSDAPKFYLGDMNHIRLDGVLRTYEQCVSCPTTQKNSVLDVCYGNLKGSYRSICLPALGASYHNSIFMVKAVKTWTEDSQSQNMLEGRRSPFKHVLTARTGCASLMLVVIILMNVRKLSHPATFCVESPLNSSLLFQITNPG